MQNTNKLKLFHENHRFSGAEKQMFCLLFGIFVLVSFMLLTVNSVFAEPAGPPVNFVKNENVLNAGYPCSNPESIWRKANEGYKCILFSEPINTETVIDTNTGKIYSCKLSGCNGETCCPGTNSERCCKEIISSQDKPVKEVTLVTPVDECEIGYIPKEKCGENEERSNTKPSITKNGKIEECCKSTESLSITNVPISFWQKAGWDFASLCLGQNKKMNALENQKNFYEKINTLGSLKTPCDLDKGIVNSGWNGKISEYYSNKGFEDYSNKLIQIINAEKSDKDIKLTTDSNVGTLCDAAKINLGKINEEIKTLEKKSGRLTHPAETMVSLISCAYGVAGGINLAAGSGDCRAETAYGGTDYCGYCNAYEPFMQCTADRCGVLGNCRTEAKQDGTGYLCLPAECTGTSSAVPHISQITAEWYQGRLILNDTDNPSGTEDHYIKPITDKVSYLVDTLNLTITTGQEAKCKYSFVNGTAFSEMTMSFDDAWKYPTTSTTMIDLTGLPLGRTHTIYIKCQSTCGATNEKTDDSQYIKFTFEARPDRMPPEIVRVVPDDKTQYLNHADRNATIEVWLNENGYCKYSTIGENEIAGNNLTTEWIATGNITAREAMAQTPTWNVRAINCVQNQTCGYTNELGSFSLYNGSVYNNINTCARCYLTIDMTTGFELVDWDTLLGDAQLLSQTDQDLLALINTYGLNTAGLTGQSKMFHYMFRCADFGSDNSQNSNDNIMPEEESYDYQIFTYPPFNMTIVEPENIGYLMDVPVFVNTTRETVCKYSIDRLYTWDNMSFIDGENYDFEHRTILENLTNAIDPGRTHTIYVRCRDLGSLEVRDSRQFRVILDNQAPIVIRMLHELSDDTLMIETNEEADCVFSQDALKKCNYNFSQGQSMMSVDKYKHSYHWMSSILYYVKCKDKWNNYPGTLSNAVQCTSVINPFDVPAI